MSDKGISALSLNIIQLIFDYLTRPELFEFHLTSKRIRKFYWDNLSLLCFQYFKPIENFEFLLNDLGSYSSETLVNIVFLTKQHLVLAKLASYSISQLCKVNYNFTSLDFSNTLIPGADLSNGIFQRIDFSFSNLNSCNFSRAFISDCNFFKANLKNSSFGTKIITGHLQTINALVISENKKFLISTGYDRLIKFWEIPTFKLIKTLQSLHKGPVSALCLSSDNSYLISAEQNIRLWDLNDGICKTLDGHLKKVTGLSMSAGNGIFISSSVDGTIKLWETETGKCKKTFRLDSAVMAVMMSPEGKLIVSGGKSGEVALFDKKGSCLSSNKTSSLAIRCVFIDLKYIVTGNDEGVVILKDRSNTIIREHKGHSDAVTCVKINGEFIYSSGGDHDCSIRKWEISSGNCVDVVLGHSSSVNSFVVYCRSTLSAGKDKLIRMMDTGYQIVEADWIECLIVLDDKESVAAGYAVSGVRIWKNGEISNRISIPSKVMSLAYQNSTLAIGCWNMKIYLNNSESLPLIGHSDAIITMQFLNIYLVSGAADGTIKIWIYEENYCINTLPINSGYVHKVVANSKFAIGACGCSLTKIVVWDLENDTNFFFFIQRGRIKALAISENFFITGGSENPLVEIWDFEGHLIKCMGKHTEAVTEICLIGDMIVSASDDKWIYVWDWRNDVFIAQYYGFVVSGFLEYDGGLMACESKGNSLQFYHLNVDDEIRVTMKWRTVKMFECRNSNFKATKNFAFEDERELENYTLYIR